MIRIAVTGPESTGKTFLTSSLASHFGVPWVPEFARSYLAKTGGNYTFHDLEIIARGQTEAENSAAILNPELLFCDTELTVIKIWAEHRFGECPPWVIQNLYNIKYDLYLLCNTDLPWEPDPQREHPHLRRYFFEWYQRELSQRKLPIAIVHGTGINRINNAIGAVERLIGDKNQPDAHASKPSNP